MGAYVLIIMMAMSSYDGGVAVNWVPFSTAKACEDAATIWNERRVDTRGRAHITAMCHATGAAK